ncbi:MAG: TonB family protein [Tannerellaceae bacterium]|jgi:TonB family protein|nr:TonB family protein [Tannerellaceae bacterium]
MASKEKASPRGGNDKRRFAAICGVAGTVVFHAVALLLLWLTVLRSKAPERQEWIAVGFEEVEEVDAASGIASGGLSAATDEEEDPVTVTPAPATTPEKLVTQKIEESVSVPDTRKEEEEADRKAAERAAREEAERQRKEREAAIARRVSGAFGASTSATSADAAGSVPFGASDSGTVSGTGGYGSFDLNGRSLGAAGLPRPAYVIQEEGRIVVNITVDPKGKVIFAEIGRGTTIDNNAMRRSALEAARRATFNAIEGVRNQTGAITYVYNLK